MVVAMLVQLLASDPLKKNQKQGSSQKALPRRPSINFPALIWVVVKIRVPFWVRHLIFRVALNLTTTHMQHPYTNPTPWPTSQRKVALALGTQRRMPWARSKGSHWTSKPGALG